MKENIYKFDKTDFVINMIATARIITQNSIKNYLFFI